MPSAQRFVVHEDSERVCQRRIVEGQRSIMWSVNIQAGLQSFERIIRKFHRMKVVFSGGLVSLILRCDLNSTGVTQQSAEEGV